MSGARDRKLLYGLYAACAVLVAADLLYHKHVHYAFEEWIGFYAGLAFLACVGLVLLGRALRAILTRDEDPYER